MHAAPATVYHVKTSIVIPACGGRALTQECIASIARWTPEDHEIILVDNGSDDDTAEWFAARDEGILIRSRTRLGFAAAVNLGIAAARGDVVVLLNNDTQVTERWLGAIIDAFARDAEVGIVGVRSNYIIAEQALADCPAPGPELDVFAHQRTTDLAGQGHRVLRLSGMCMAIDRRVIDAIGALDPRFHPGYYEDDDYSLRARRAGFALWLCEDSFVWHLGSQTINDHPDGAMRGVRLMQANNLRFIAKWGIAQYTDPLRDLAHLVGPGIDVSGDFIALPDLG